MTNIEHVHGWTDGRRVVADGRMPVIRTARLLPAFVRFKDPGDYQTRVMMNAVCSDHFIMTQIFLTLILAKLQSKYCATRTRIIHVGVESQPRQRV